MFMTRLNYAANLFNLHLAVGTAQIVMISVCFIHGSIVGPNVVWTKVGLTLMLAPIWLFIAMLSALV